jgi:hypothetical protein
MGGGPGDGWPLISNNPERDFDLDQLCVDPCQPLTGGSAVFCGELALAGAID